MNVRLLAATLAIPALAFANPGSTVRSLMSEPATLLDIGMLRLQILTLKFENQVGLHWTTGEGEMEFFRADVNSRYDPDDQKIYVGFLVMNSDATPAQLEEGCGNAMRHMGFWLGKSLPEFFSHVGDKARWSDLHEAFEEMVVLRCYISSERDTSEGRFWASRTLGDSEITIGKWPTD